VSAPAPLTPEEAAIVAAMANRSQHAQTLAVLNLRMAREPRFPPQRRAQFLERAADWLVGDAS